MVSLPGAIAFQGFSRSPRHGGEALWLVISVDFGRTDIPVHFSLLTGSEVRLWVALHQYAGLCGAVSV